MDAKTFDTIVKHVQKRGQKGTGTHRAARMVLVEGKSHREAQKATGSNLGAIWRSVKNIEKYRVCRHCWGVVLADKR